ncbi:hypothetical protein Tco_0525884, partial [Tanacetum coccineum]
HGVAGEQFAKVNPFTAADHEPFVNVFTLDYNSKASSSGEITIPESNQSTLPHEHIREMDRFPYRYLLGNSLLRMLCGVSTIPYCPKSNQKTSQSAVTKECWFQAMQEEIHKFDRLDV